MRVLVTRIHVFFSGKNTWMAGTSPAMTRMGELSAGGDSLSPLPALAAEQG